MKDFIGVTDSGVGGLTVVKQLKKTCGKDIVYIADHAFCPYGNKDGKFITERVTRICEYLQNTGASQIILACNTASTHIDEIRPNLQIPVSDVITPTCEKAAALTKNKRVALLATKHTIDSGKYQKILSANGIKTTAFDCGCFVEFIENGDVNSIAARTAVHMALKFLPIACADTVIFGCTHFPLFFNLIEPYCNGARIIQSCVNVLPNENPHKTAITYLTTGTVRQANNAAKQFAKINFKSVDL